MIRNEAKEIIAVFATKLFGEPFEPGSVVGETYGPKETVDPADGDLHLASEPVTAADIAAAAAAESDQAVAEILGNAMLNGPATPDTVRSALPVAWLERILWDGVLSMADLVNRYIKDVRPGATREEAASRDRSCCDVGRGREDDRSQGQ